jgi:hypothetical protein
MRIVIAHGRAAAMDIKGDMQRQLQDALRWGLERVDSPLATDPALDIRLAFFGDLWRADDGDQPPPIVYPAEIAEEFVPEGGQIGLNVVGDFFDQLFGIGDDILHNVLKDLLGYFTIESLRRATNDIVARACLAPPLDPEGVILVGFSMGSFVGYDLLRSDMDAKTLPVRSFVTIGSPLAMHSMIPYVRANDPDLQRRGTPYPAQVPIWANLWTEDDPGVSGHDRMAQIYADASGEHAVQDFETHGRGTAFTNPAGPHNAMDYLSSKVMGYLIADLFRRVPLQA